MEGYGNDNPGSKDHEYIKLLINIEAENEDTVI